MTRRITPPSVNAAIIELATRQLGVVSRIQLLALGLTATGIDERVRAGRLLPLHPGVYCVGHRALTERAHWRAALLAAPPGAVLSHFTAAAAWDLLTGRGGIHLSAPGRTGRLWLDGVVAHRPRSLPRDEVGETDGFAVTTVSRTLVDLAAVARRSELERAVNQAQIQGRFDLRALQRVLARSNGRRGVGQLRDVVAGWSGVQPTWSELEAAFLLLCRDAGVPEPVVNGTIAYEDGLYRPDFYWPDRRLVIETDGYASHSTRSAHQGDRRRDRRLRRMGLEVERFSWEDVFLEPVGTAAEIADIVQRHPPRP